MSNAAELARLAQRLQWRTEQAVLQACAGGDSPAGDSLAEDQVAASLPDCAARRRWASRCFERRFGAWPALTEMGQGANALALLAQPELLAQLCTLALSCRPGFFRSCVQRERRLAFQTLLGPAYLSLHLEHGSFQPSAEQQAWGPATWSCLAFLDLQQAAAWAHPGLCELVRSTLPQAELKALLPLPRPAALRPVLTQLPSLVTWFKTV